ncbi:unnamed protein product [Lampetra fluviatilis]
MSCVRPLWAWGLWMVLVSLAPATWPGLGTHALHPDAPTAPGPRPPGARPCLAPVCPRWKTTTTTPKRSPGLAALDFPSRSVNPAERRPGGAVDAGATGRLLGSKGAAAAESDAANRMAFPTGPVHSNAVHRWPAARWTVAPAAAVLFPGLGSESVNGRWTRSVTLPVLPRARQDSPGAVISKAPSTATATAAVIAPHRTTIARRRPQRQQQRQRRRRRRLTRRGTSTGRPKPRPPRKAPTEAPEYLGAGGGWRGGIGEAETTTYNGTVEWGPTAADEDLSSIEDGEDLPSPVGGMAAAAASAVPAATATTTETGDRRGSDDGRKVNEHGESEEEEEEAGTGGDGDGDGRRGEGTTSPVRIRTPANVDWGRGKDIAVDRTPGGAARSSGEMRRVRRVTVTGR